MRADLPSSASGPPALWWGDAWSRRVPRLLPDLVASGALSAEGAEFLAQHVGAGGSVVIVSPDSGVGKSTLAWALTAAIPDGRVRRVVRGSFEPFDWLGGADPSALALLVNELSPHLPTYCWGGVARRVLQCAAAGAQVVATGHALGASDFALQLTAPPIRATAREIAALGLVVSLQSAATRPGPPGEVRIIEPLPDLLLGSEAPDHLPIWTGCTPFTRR